MELLPDIINTSDVVVLYDNSADFQTSIMLHKKDEKAFIFSNSPSEDKFLQETIIQPLEETYHYKIIYCDSVKDEFNALRIYSVNDLTEFEKQVKNDVETVSIKANTELNLNK